jgi:hypothetical protein
MKLKIVLLALIGAAGATSSFALADSGHHGRGHENGKKDQACKNTVLFGTAAPQSFTVTVTHAGRHSPFSNGDVVTVSLGTQGQTVAVTGVGCGDGSTLQAGTALLHVRMVRPPHHEPTTTTVTTTGDRGKGHHHDGTTTTSTTTATTTTDESTNPETTTSDTTTSDTTTTSDSTTTSDNTTTTNPGN